ncbi:thioredoxin-dependent thiol peroxidase [Nosocomiicoccus ampullae]|uniref:thioredoxin-dependent peroxiredoxin n=1 Tax=Nosocomiicoccus ampullae TaxID=489910 RepID=A0A9Q2HFS8_9STAP|nr:thioredoxin-dependent thiol peroxidase [Nosocomiicoccus ampullae]MBB5176453.1 peroxiredoxin Q/BCP [Nosocomiicoccus ampullae]QYA46497.1 thioredoxin-dependent thiol peroxidase [Nosocomiicoccus ampullae]
MAQFPKFKLENQNGDIVTNEDLTGQTVIYFYPKDNTPGCTTQACDIRDNIEEFNALDVKVYGVSGDSKESHQKFIEKKDLNFDLLVDENNELAAEADVIGDKNVFGKKVRGIVRTTFIVDENNEILKRFDKVSPKKHVEQVLEFLKEG